jgi:hypothetical protein
MTREEKCLLAIEKGFTYNPQTGKIYGIRGSIINCKLHKAGYIHFTIRLNKKEYKLLGHHFAWYWVYKNCDFEQLDHINGIRNDNRIENLRIVSNQQNNFNRHFSKGDKKVKGYHKYYNKFIAQIGVDNKYKYLGLFNTEQEAREAYLKAKEKYHVI